MLSSFQTVGSHLEVARRENNWLLSHVQSSHSCILVIIPNLNCDCVSWF
jgi:hypothetical protein